MTVWKCGTKTAAEHYRIKLAAILDCTLSLSVEDETGLQELGWWEKEKNEQTGSLYKKTC
jgi:hypothetical protein